MATMTPKNWALVLAVGLLLGGGVYFQHQKDTGELVTLFEKEYPKNQSATPAEQRSDAIREYIFECCKSEQAVLQLLNQNGFEIKKIDAPAEIRDLNKHYANSKKWLQKKYPKYEIVEYDAFIFAKKKTMIVDNLLYLPAIYEISFYLKNAEVHWLTAGIDRTLP